MGKLDKEKAEIEARLAVWDRDNAAALADAKAAVAAIDEAHREVEGKRAALDRAHTNETTAEAERITTALFGGLTLKASTETNWGRVVAEWAIHANPWNSLFNKVHVRLAEAAKAADPVYVELRAKAKQLWEEKNKLTDAVSRLRRARDRIEHDLRDVNDRIERSKRNRVTAEKKKAEATETPRAEVNRSLQQRAVMLLELRPTELAERIAKVRATLPAVTASPVTDRGQEDVHPNNALTGPGNGETTVLPGSAPAHCILALARV